MLPLNLLPLKLDPGSKTTGIALLKGDKVIWGAELTHRGQAIKASLESRRSLRRSRRKRHTRYRKARFLNRIRPQGWLTPRPTASSRNHAYLGKQVDQACAHWFNCSRTGAF